MKCCHFSVAGFFLSALVVSAAAETPVPVVKETNFLEILAKGGIMMYPLGLMSVITVLLILIFLLTIRRNAIVSDRFMNTAESMIRKRDYLGLSHLQPPPQRVHGPHHPENPRFHHRQSGHARSKMSAKSPRPRAPTRRACSLPGSPISPISARSPRWSGCSAR